MRATRSCGRKAAGLQERFGDARRSPWFRGRRCRVGRVGARCRRRRGLQPARRPAAAVACRRRTRSRADAGHAAHRRRDGRATTSRISLPRRSPRSASASNRRRSLQCSPLWGRRSADNPGRLMRFERDGVQVLVDYAHNRRACAACCRFAAGLRGDGGPTPRLVLGHAGNTARTGHRAARRHGTGLVRRWWCSRSSRTSSRTRAGRSAAHPAHGIAACWHDGCCAAATPRRTRSCRSSTAMGRSRRRGRAARARLGCPRRVVELLQRGRP